MKRIFWVCLFLGLASCLGVNNVNAAWTRQDVTPVDPGAGLTGDDDQPGATKHASPEAPAPITPVMSTTGTKESTSASSSPPPRYEKYVGFIRIVMTRLLRFPLVLE